MSNSLINNVELTVSVIVNACLIRCDCQCRLDKGEAKATRQSKFGVCGEYGHRRGSAKCRYTGAKTRYSTILLNLF